MTTVQNDYHDYLLAHAGDNQMQTLNRDIQLLNLASNNISILKRNEFSRKKFRNLQKLYLNTNQLMHVDSDAFFKLTGLVELDVSENLISRFDESLPEPGDADKQQAPDGSADDDEPEPRGATTSPGSQDSSAAARANKTQPISGSKRNFLRHLVQLRVLNMNLNQLVRLEAFTFAPLVQLRQLFLSK